MATELGATLLDHTGPTRGATFLVSGLALNGAGAAHASALSAALELAGYLALLPELTESEYAVTHSIALNLITGAPQGHCVEVSGEVDRRSKKLAFITVAARADGQIVARGRLVKSIVAFAAPAL